MSGASFPGPVPAAGAPMPGVSSPVQLPAPGMAAVSAEGPLHFIARALMAQLTTVFPQNLFTAAYVDGKITREQWQQITRRPPAVLLGWAGCEPDREMGGVFEAHSKWFVGLVTKNLAGAQERLLGDRVGPGLLSMVRIASIALHGFVIAPKGQDWAASGAVQVTAANAMFLEDWIDADIAVAGLELSVPYRETLPPGFDTLARFATLGVTWNFPAGAEFTDTIATGG